MAVFTHPVLNLENKQVGTVDLLAEVFKLEEINNHLIWESVRHHLARRRTPCNSPIDLRASECRATLIKAAVINPHAHSGTTRCCLRAAAGRVRIPLAPPLYSACPPSSTGRPCHQC